jgi:hypothetical protein
MAGFGYVQQKTQVGTFVVTYQHATSVIPRVRLCFIVENDGAVRGNSRTSDIAEAFMNAARCFMICEHVIMCIKTAKEFIMNSDLAYLPLE